MLEHSVDTKTAAAGIAIAPRNEATEGNFFVLVSMMNSAVVRPRKEGRLPRLYSEKCISYAMELSVGLFETRELGALDIL